MRSQSWMAIALCLMAFACKKSDSKSNKGGAGSNLPAVAAPNTGDQTGAPGSNGGGSTMPQLSTEVKSCEVLKSYCEDVYVPEGPAAGFDHSTNTVKKALFDTKLNPMTVHRGRDVIMNHGQDSNLIVKFAYGVAVDSDVKDEKVDIFMSLGCKAGWKKVGSAVTSSEPKYGSEISVDGIPDTGGFVMTSLSKLGLKDLGVGRHHLVFVLKATNEVVDLYIEVLPKKSAVVLSDIDGTLTGFEEAAAADFFGLPVLTHKGAPEMMQAYHQRGYTIFYLTARPVFFLQKTRQWLASKGFPPGVIHTTSFVTGAIGEKAVQFKVGELAMLKEKLGIIPSYAFGNKPSDVKAFADAGVDKSKSWYYKISGDTTGAQAHSDYSALIPGAQAAPQICN